MPLFQMFPGAYIVVFKIFARWPDESLFGVGSEEISSGLDSGRQSPVAAETECVVNGFSVFYQYDAGRGVYSPVLGDKAV